MDGSDNTREQGIEFNSLAEELENESYPLSKDELLDHHGNSTLEFADGEATLKEILDTGNEREFEDTDDVRQTVFAMVEEGAVGREAYSDRGGATPDEAIADEEESL